MIRLRLYRLFEYASQAGVDKQPEESLKKNVVVANLFALANVSIATVSNILFFFFTDNKFPATVNFFVCLLFITPIYINKKGLFLLSKIVHMILSIFVLFGLFCWLSHRTQLKNVFLIYCAITPMLFSWYNERKWLIITECFAITCFVLESTSLVRFLPDMNRLRDFARADIVTVINQTLLIVCDIAIFIYINRKHELELLEIQYKLRESRRLLRIQNEDLRTFSAAASHSMQNPLYVAQFFLDKTDRELQHTEEGRKHKKAVEVIRESLQQIDQLVTGLFSYQRINKIKNEFEEFDSIHELRVLKKRILRRYPGANIYLPEHRFNVKTNQLLFSIIMQSIFENGIKFNQSAVPVINVSIENSSSSVLFSIADNGIGIKKEYWEKIFEPFKRLQNGQYPGTGLGLSGAKRAAERIGGSLFCRESSEAGSVFILILPLN